MVKVTHRKGESLPQEYFFSSPSRKRKGNKKQEMEVFSTNSLSSEIDRLINSSSIGKEFHYVPIYREHESIFCKKDQDKHGRKKKINADHARTKSDIDPSNGIKCRSKEEEDSIILGSEPIDEGIEDGEKHVLENEETDVTNNVKDQIEEVRHLRNDTNDKREYHLPNSDRIAYLECDEIDENIKNDLALDTDDTYAAFQNDVLIAPSYSLPNDIVKRDISFSKSSTDVITGAEENDGGAIKSENFNFAKDHDSAAFLEKLSNVTDGSPLKAQEAQNIVINNNSKSIIEQKPGITMTLGRSLEQSLGSSAAARRRNVLRVKIISMGPAGCGKSCLIKRFCERRFVTKYITTIGVDYGVHRVNVDQYDVRVNFWDLSGQKEFFEIRNEFYKDAQGALLVFDSTNRQTFDELEQWIEEIKLFGGNTKLPIIVCNNKIDKLQSNYDRSIEDQFAETVPTTSPFKKKKKNYFRATREVSREEAEIWCKFRGYHYFEASAATNENVDEMFECLFSKTVEDVKQMRM